MDNLILRRLALAAACALLGGPLAAAEKPNLIFILSDDLAQGDLGCYGQERIRTPNLDRMAAEGTRFTWTEELSMPIPVLGELALWVYRPFMKRLMRSGLANLQRLIGST